MGFYNEIDEKEVEILMEDNCTKSEAIHYLKKGAVIYKADEWLEYIVTEYGYYDGSEDQEIYADCETIQELKTLVYNDHIICDGVSVVDYGGQRYVIEYCL